MVLLMMLVGSFVNTKLRSIGLSNQDFVEISMRDKISNGVLIRLNHNTMLELVMLWKMKAIFFILHISVVIKDLLIALVRLVNTSSCKYSISTCCSYLTLWIYFFIN